MQCVLRFSLESLFETFFIPINVSRVTFEVQSQTDMHVGFHVNCPLFFAKLESKVEYTGKFPVLIFVNICSVVLELFVTCR
jgi:hypothetical protein